MSTVMLYLQIKSLSEVRTASRTSTSFGGHSLTHIGSNIANSACGKAPCKLYVSVHFFEHNEKL